MKALMIGAAAALVAGLAMGHDLRPNLWVGPQVMESSYGDPIEPDVVPTGWSRAGPAPDYVVGTDWLPKPYVYDEVPLDVSDTESEPTFAALIAAPPAPPPASDQPDQPAPEIAYPSMGGGVLVSTATMPAPPPIEPSA